MLHPPRRLFIGLLPEKSVQSQIQRHCRDWSWPEGTRPTRFGRYHLTLHFLGQVGAAPEQILRKALRTMPMQALELELTTPHLWQHGIAVLRPRDHQGLMELRERIGALLPRAGLFTPKSFTPHVTLARDAHFAEPPKHETSIRWSVREFVLVWSRLPPEVKPARYEVLERFGVNDLAWSQGGESGGQFPLFGAAAPPQCSRRQKQ